MAVASVAAVKAHSISRKEPPHYRGKGSESCSKKEMGMIRDEHPCVTGSFTLREEFRKALQKILPVPVVYEYLSTLDTPDHDVLQKTGRVQAGLSWHCSILLQNQIRC